jgi:hypothetical protein
MDDDRASGQVSAGRSRTTTRGVFLSYRRADSAPWTGRLADDLRDYFGKDRVYLDLDSNRAAQDYIVQIEEVLNASSAVIAIIGPSWAGDADSGSRLHDTEDVVRKELESAFSIGIPVFIVLVGGARVPARTDLPSSLRALARLQALRMADEDWDYDRLRLLEALEHHGLYPAFEPRGKSSTKLDELVVGKKHYERTVRASS